MSCFMQKSMYTLQKVSRWISHLVNWNHHLLMYSSSSSAWLLLYLVYQRQTRKLENLNHPDGLVRKLSASWLCKYAPTMRFSWLLPLSAPSTMIRSSSDSQLNPGGVTNMKMAIFYYQEKKPWTQKDNLTQHNFLKGGGHKPDFSSRNTDQIKSRFSLFWI